VRRVLLAVASLLPGCAGAETYPYYHSGEPPPEKSGYEDFVKSAVENANHAVDRSK
jgi:hypothetical protein